MSERDFCDGKKWLQEANYFEWESYYKCCGEDEESVVTRYARYVQWNVNLGYVGPKQSVANVFSK